MKHKALSKAAREAIAKLFPVASDFNGVEGHFCQISSGKGWVCTRENGHTDGPHVRHILKPGSLGDRNGMPGRKLTVEDLPFIWWDK